MPRISFLSDQQGGNVLAAAARRYWPLLLTRPAGGQPHFRFKGRGAGPKEPEEPAGGRGTCASLFPSFPLSRREKTSH
jgi:hypothetical protein